MNDTRSSVDEVAAMLKKTGDAHHSAYHATDGTDPEWASWYAGHFQALLGDGLGHPITRSEIVYLLLKAERAQAASGSDEAWPVYYAKLILAET